jgi:WD40 repeat protein
MGGMEGVLERSAEGLYACLDPEGQEMARQLFLRLVTLGEGVEDTRRRALRSELEALHIAGLATAGENGAGASALPGIDPGAMAQIIDRFGKARLLSFDLDPLTRTPTADITHEALLREWPRLRGWLDDGRADVRTQRALTSAAAEWDKANRDRSFLLHGVRLSQFESWASDTNLALTGVERAYLQASLDQREAQRRAEEERQTQLAALERRSRNVLRVLVGVFAAAAIVSLLLSLYAFNQQRLARQAQALSVSRELAVQAINTLEEDPELSILLALEGLRTAETREAEESLHTSIRSSRLRMTLNVAPDGEGVWSVHFSPDGKWIAAPDGEKDILQIWNAASGQKLNEVKGHLGRFNPSGSLLATAGDDNNIYLYETANWEVVNTFKGHTETIHDIQFNPQGTLLVGASYDETFSVWEIVSGQQVFSGPAAVHSYSTFDDTRFSPDGKLLFVADFHGDTTVEFPATMRVYDVEGEWALVNEFPSIEWTFNFSPDGRWQVTRGEELLRAIIMRDISAYPGDVLASVNFSDMVPIIIPEAHEVVVSKFTFNRDGSLLATSGLSGEAKVWSISEEGADHLMTLDGHQYAIVDIDINPDSTRVATASLDGTVRVWDITLAGASEGFALDAHKDGIYRFNFTPDGSLLSTASSDTTAKVWDTATGRTAVDRPR